MKGSDIFVADGLVWTGLMVGHDPKTGEVKRRLTQEMHQPMGHDRCYRNRITETYFINSKTGGSDFVALDGRGEFPGPWVRATCGLGPVPCNGMLYSSPFSCSCLKGTMLTGFKALYSDDRAAGKVMRIDPRDGLVKGPAYGTAPTISTTAADWPVYRNDNARSGRTSTPVDGELVGQWQTKLPSRPTAPTIVGDLVYVAARDSHVLYALSRQTGKTVWTFTAGGRIDSPPSFHQGLLLLGCRDGSVYALRADDGQLAWRFCDLPTRRLIAADGQLESAWPVSGAVMVRDGVAYFAAGRSSFLDGGIVVYGLDPSTGRVIHRRQVSGPYAENGFPIVGERNTRIEGFKGGIFSSEGDLLYIRHQAFRPDLTPVPLAELKEPHLIASAGFLDDVPQHRTYWTIDTDLCYGPNTGTIGAGPQGDILVMDEDVFYEIRGYLPGRHSTKLDPLQGYTLYSGRRAGADTDGAWQADRRLRTVPRSGAWRERWSTQIPLTGNALVAGRRHDPGRRRSLAADLQAPSTLGQLCGPAGRRPLDGIRQGRHEDRRVRAPGPARLGRPRRGRRPVLHHAQGRHGHVPGIEVTDTDTNTGLNRMVTANRYSFRACLIVMLLPVFAQASTGRLAGVSLPARHAVGPRAQPLGGRPVYRQRQRGVPVLPGQRRSRKRDLDLCRPARLLRPSTAARRQGDAVDLSQPAAAGPLQADLARRHPVGRLAFEPV